MAGKKKGRAGFIASGLVADNRRARHDFDLVDALAAGLVLTGSEVKSLRAGAASLAQAHVGARGGALWLLGAHIAEWPQAAAGKQHDPARARKLLVKAREVARLTGAAEREGYTIVPLRLYFTERGRAKLSIALGKGRKLHDKREADKARDWARGRARLLRERG